MAVREYEIRKYHCVLTPSQRGWGCPFPFQMQTQQLFSLPKSRAGEIYYHIFFFSSTDFRKGEMTEKGSKLREKKKGRREREKTNNFKLCKTKKKKEVTVWIKNESSNQSLRRNRRNLNWDGGLPLDFGSLHGGLWGYSDRLKELKSILNERRLRVNI